MKMRARFPYVYFFMEPNIVFVYIIKTLTYLTASDLEGWETFELSNEDEFDTFCHEDKEPLVGRGYFLSLDQLNIMVEQLNQQIQKQRKLEEKMPVPVHIVSSESITGSLKYGLERPRTVIGFQGLFSIGPIWQLNRKAGQEFRHEWLYENINLEYDDYELENKFTNTLLEIEDIPDQAPIYLWAAQNGEEQTWLRFIIHLLKDKTNDVFLINTSASRTAELQPDQLRTLFEKNNAAALSLEERMKYQKEWEILAESKGLLRLWLNERVEEVSEDYYDNLIISTIGGSDFIKAARVIGNVMSQMDEMVSDAFLEYRLRYLVYSGALELKGIPKSMRHYSVKLR